MSQDIRSLTSTNLHRHDSHQRTFRHYQSVCWRLQPSTCQLGLQRNISWWRETSLLVNRQQPCAAAKPKGSSPFLISSMERRHKLGPGLRECRLGQPTAWQTCSSKVPEVTTLALSQKCHRSSKFLPTAIRWNVGTFARMIGKVFAFLQENPLIDCHLRTQQTSSRHTRNYVRACYVWLNNVSP